MSEQTHKDKLAEALAARMNRRGFMKLMGSGAGLAAGSAIMGSTLVQNAMAAAPKRGGTIKLAWVDAVDTLDPHFTASLGSVKILNNIFNGLLKVAYDGKKVSFVPDLAEKWEMPDDKTHVFKLRKGVKFHNGDACDAEAVKWSLERVKDPAVGSPHAWKFEQLAGIDIVDDHTIRMRFNKPYAFLPVALTGSTGRAGTIVSKRAVEQYGKGSLMLAGDRFIIFSGSGKLATADLTPEGCKEISGFQAVKDKDTWAAPVLANGLLYARSRNQMVCLDVKK